VSLPSKIEVKMLRLIFIQNCNDSFILENQEQTFFIEALLMKDFFKAFIGKKKFGCLPNKD
jgi:hypothetical protein